VYIHGGMTDFWHAQGQFDMFRRALDTMRECGVAAGYAGHRLEIHEWIRDNLTPDFQMCSYYDPTPRATSAHHVSTTAGFRFLARSMRPGDIVCIGHYLRDNPEMIAENVQTFDRVVEGALARR